MKRRILLADDSVTIQKVIELTFMDEDYEVRAVSNGDEALSLLTEINPDFVIADVHMPGANGYDVCRRAKQQRPDVPVLLLVGTFEPFDEAQARSAGADSHLKKPFDSQELLQRVEDLLASRPAQAAPAAPSFAAAAPAAAAASMLATPPPEPKLTWGAQGTPEWAVPAATPPPAPPVNDWAPQPAPETDWAQPAQDWSQPAQDWGAAPAAAPDWLSQPSQDWNTPPAPDLPPVAGTGNLPEFPAEPAEPAWGFQMEPEPAAAPASPEPFDREVSFDLEPVPPSYQVEEEAVFTIEEDTPSFGVREDVFGAPSELSLDELPPQDRYVEDAPAPASAGFDWSAIPNAEPQEPSFAAPEPEPLRMEEPAAFPWDREPAPAPAPLAAWTPAPDEVLATEPEPAVPEPAPMPPVPAAEPAPYVAPAAAAAATAVTAAAAPAPANGHGRLSDEDVDRIARRVVELLGDRTVRDVAWEVIPDMAELIIRDRLRELEAQVE